MPPTAKQLILEAMKAKNISRIQLARETGIEYTRICEYINGYRRPRPERARKIAEKLGVDWTCFFT